MDSEVMDFIARACTSSVRELEGAVIKLLAYSSLHEPGDHRRAGAVKALQGVLRAGQCREATPRAQRRNSSARRVARRVERVKSEALASKRRTRGISPFPDRWRCTSSGSWLDECRSTEIGGTCSEDGTTPP
jgi:chromosomal replication initiation ATPase DnaA